MRRSAALLLVLGFACTRRVAYESPAIPEPPPTQFSKDWYRGSIGYEIFVRSFRDSDGDGIGDLRGVTEKLDYLVELGVDLLWLMPINEGPTYHGYAVSDYRAIEGDYGSMQDFDQLIDQASRRNMRVILDLVVNHTSAEHPAFVAATRSPTSEHRDWYSWRMEDPGWTQPWGPGKVWHRGDVGYYYGLFDKGMPDLNLTNTRVRREIREIAEFWLQRGVAGFRLDAARYLIEDGGPKGLADTPATHLFWRHFRGWVEHARAHALLVGEVWEDGSVIVPYFGTPEAPELQMNFDFEAASGVLNSIRRGDAEPIRAALERRLATYPSWASAGSFLANHDQYRVASVLERSGKDGGRSARRLAAALLLLLPGTPWLYYGEEIGMANGAAGNDDRLKRRPMQWDAGPRAGFTEATPWMAPTSTAAADSVTAQKNDPQSLWSLYQRLVKFRRAHVEIQTGATQIVPSQGTRTEPLVVVRGEGARQIWLVFNFADETNDVIIPAQAAPPTLVLKDELTLERYRRTDTREPFRIERIEPFGFRVLKVE